ATRNRVACQLVGCIQCRRRITGTPAEPGPGRDALGESHPDSEFPAGRLEHRVSGTPREVLLAGSDIGAGDLKLDPRIDSLDLEFVSQLQPTQQRLKSVHAARFARQHVQEQVELGWAADSQLRVHSGPSVALRMVRPVVSADNTPISVIGTNVST